jgi:tetratricopeptide (TPR) repeat protein
LREAEQSYSEAEKNHKEALKIYRELAADNPQMYNPYIATASMNVEAVLWKLASLQHQAKRYKSVEQIYKELLNLYKEMTGRDGELYNQKIATTYGNLSFIQIFNNEFSDAIISAEQGIKYDSTQIWIYANMAHGYLLSGNFEKAKEIYLTYKDVDLNGKTFAQSCLEDFDEFAKAGIVNPDIEKIKELLKK